MNNALKHADAQKIHIHLIQRKNEIELTVEDDGVGCAAGKVEEIIQNGFGLSNVYTRVHSLGGRFLIKTQTGKGFASTVKIPV